MNNSTKIKNNRKEKLIKYRNDDSFQNLNHSFQSSEINNKLKLKYSILDSIKLSNFRKSIILKINQIQNNQQKTNIKLSSLISILISKLIGNKNYKIFHTHFSIINNKKIQNIINIKKENNKERVKTESNKENNNTERLNINNININKKKIENISLASELEIKRYNLSNQKTKTRENIFKLNNEKQYSSNNKHNKYEKDNEELYSNSNSNLFRINNNNNYNNNLNKNPSSDNLNNSKKHFNISNSRKPVAFNEITSNLNYQNNNRNNFYSNANKNKNITYNNENNNNNDLKKIYINASNYNNIQKNNSNNREKDFNKSNISLDNNSNKGPVKIKFNSIEKPILLMNFNESLEKSSERNKLNKNKNNFNNIINISNNFIERKDDKKYNSINESQGLSLKIEDSTNNLNYKKENGDASPDSIRGKRKFSESKSEAESNYSNLSDAKHGQGFSRKIRGFNFRNNIKFNKKPNSNKMLDDDYNKIKGGSVRYSNNNGLLAQINSFENDYK